MRLASFLPSGVSSASRTAGTSTSSTTVASISVSASANGTRVVCRCEETGRIGDDVLVRRGDEDLLEVLRQQEVRVCVGRERAGQQDVSTGARDRRERFGAHLLRVPSPTANVRVSIEPDTCQGTSAGSRAVGEHDERVPVERRGARVQRRARELDAIADRGRAAGAERVTAPSTSARCVLAGWNAASGWPGYAS